MGESVLLSLRISVHRLLDTVCVVRTNCNCGHIFLALCRGEDLSFVCIRLFKHVVEVFIPTLLMSFPRFVRTSYKLTFSLKIHEYIFCFL